MDWTRATTKTLTNQLGATYTYDRMPAKYAGTRSEFFTGVTPGAVGEAERVTYCTGSQSFSFSVGGPWLSIYSEDELAEVAE